jgi:hypothetical protein
MSVTTAILRLDVEGGSAVTSEVRKAVGDLKGAQKDIEKASVDAVARIEAAQKAASERARGRRRKDAVETVQETVQVAARQGDAYRGAAVVAERAEQLVTRSKLKELAKQGDEQKKWLDLYKAAHAQATAAMEAEVGKRETLSQREKGQIESVALAIVASHEQAERQRTAATAQQGRERVQRERANAALARQAWAGVGAVGGAALDAGQQYAGAAHGVIQDAATRRNAIQSTVGEALLQVGVTDLSDVNRYTDQVISAGGAANMRPEAIAEAIQQAQERTNLVGRMSGLQGGARDAVFTDAINTAVRGRNLGLDPSEFTELHGMLTGRGLTDADRAGLESWSVGAQDRGALNISTLLRQSKASITQRMAAASNALPANASREQRSSAEAAAFRQAVAEIEVLKDAGVNAGVGSGAMATYERVLSNTGTQAKMRTSLSHIADPALRRRVTETLFDRNGLRAGLTNPLMFTGALLSAGMTDPTMTANIFAGTGAGNAQSLAANIRRMQTALQGRDADNRSGVDRVRAYLAPGVAITPEEEARRAAARAGLGANVAEGESVRGMQSTLAHGNQVGLSGAVARAGRQNPLGVLGVSTAMTALAGLLAKSPVGAGILAHVVGAYGTVRSVVTGETVDGRALSAGERLRRGAGYAVGAAAAGTGSAFAAPVMVAGMLMPGVGDTARVGGNQFRGSGTGEALSKALLDLLPDRIAQAMGRVTIIVTQSTTDGVHHDTTNAGNGGR